MMSDEKIELKSWAVIREQDSTCINAIIWDGVSKWDVPDGCYVISLDGIDWYDIGAVYDKTTNTFTASNNENS